MKTSESYLFFASRAQWRQWLEVHHADASEAWLVHYKKSAGQPGLTYGEAVEEALCFGWIDGLLRPLDATRYLLRYSPRRPNSVWADSNKKRVAKLIDEGRMTQAGLDVIALAKANGSWDVLKQIANGSAIPADLENALCAYDGAMDGFAALPASLRQQYLWWIAGAKRDATRRKRIEEIVRRAVARQTP
jgi:uncharacterized protein YdeI (YjbR/CyaY-like superfamily)